MTAGGIDPQPATRRRLNIPLLIIGLVAVLVAAVVAVVAVRGGDDEGPAGSRQGVLTIKAADGIGLTARVTRPSGSGRHPLVVMPSSYNANYNEYVAVGRALTEAGFVTVSYTSRGFFTSGGRVDLAGPKTRRDAITVIDWALKNTAADPGRIGMLGVSYGGGISLLTAAADKRVRAVVALSTWTDLAEAFHPNDTINVLGLGGLLSVPRAAPELTTLGQQLRSDPVGNGAKFDAFVRSRSPSTYLTELNRNKPAVMLGNGWQDSLFSPTMLVPFYSKLAGPKRLQLSTGDHTGPEQDLLAGKRSALGDASLAWLRHYLDGQDNGIDKQQPVQLEDVTTDRLQGYPGWPSPAPTSLSLAAPSTSQVAITSQPATWEASLQVGQDSGATIGGSQFVPSERYVLPGVSLKDLPGDRALVWGVGPTARATRVTGAVTMSVSVSADSPNATLMAYLYDFGPDARGKLMAMTPYTVTGANSGTPKPVSIPIEPVDWTLAAGHQLTVVVDTVDPWWVQAATPGSTLRLSSTPTNPAGVTIPVG